MQLSLYAVGDFTIMIFAASQIPANIRPKILFHFESGKILKS